MTSQETPTENKQLKSWDELESPYDHIGIDLDETTVPPEKQELYETVLAAQHSALDQERENEARAKLEAEAAVRQAFLAERRQAANARLNKVAVQSAVESTIEDSFTNGPVYHTAPDGSLITPAEAEDMRSARLERSER